MSPDSDATRPSDEPATRALGRSAALILRACLLTGGLALLVGVGAVGYLYYEFTGTRLTQRELFAFLATHPVVAQQLGDVTDLAIDWPRTTIADGHETHFVTLYGTRGTGLAEVTSRRGTAGDARRRIEGGSLALSDGSVLPLDNSDGPGEELLPPGIEAAGDAAGALPPEPPEMPRDDDPFAPSDGEPFAEPSTDEDPFLPPPPAESSPEHDPFGEESPPPPGSGEVPPAGELPPGDEAPTPDDAPSAGSVSPFVG